MSDTKDTMTPKPPDLNDLLVEGALPDDPADGLVVAERPPDGPPIVWTSSGKYFVREKAGYYPIGTENMFSEVGRCCPEVERFLEDENGNSKPMKPQQLYDAYGRRADSIVYEMGGRGRFEPRGQGGTLVVQCCNHIEVKPEFSQPVATWLELMAGDHHLRFLDWISVFTLLQQPVAAAYIQGDGSIGKGLLALSLQSGYNRVVASYDDVVLGEYNGPLLKTPLIVLDEGCAAEDRKSVAGLRLRRLIGGYSHQLTEKYVASGTLRGCPRLLITANDANALRLPAEDTRQSEKAIALRILHFKVGDASIKYLKDLGKAVTASWVDDLIAWKHFLWLRDNHTLSRPGHRFLVEGDPATWLAGAAAREGLARTILVAVARYLCGHTQVQGEVAKVIRDTTHLTAGVWVDVGELYEHWQACAAQDSRPPAAKLSKALQSIATPDLTPALRTGWGHAIQVEHLRTAVRETGCVTEAQLERVLK